MLCKKHEIEECNSSDCEACGLEAENKRLNSGVYLRVYEENKAPYLLPGNNNVRHGLF